MSRVITFSRFFPVSHPRAGEPTQFVEKIWLSLVDCGFISMSKVVELSNATGIGDLDIYKLRKLNLSPKGHTIRTGNRWKVGDKFSPRVWSGKPYQSKQMQFAPDIEIRKTWDIEVGNGAVKVDTGICWEAWDDFGLIKIETLALNDGLSYHDFISWFNIHPKAKKETFKGQILSWSESISYS